MAGDQGVRFANRQSFLLNLQTSQFKIVSDLFRCVTPPQLLAIVELPRPHFDVFSRPTHTNATALNRRTVRCNYICLPAPWRPLLRSKRFAYFLWMT
ncbi:hypothetical protein HanXRQr2_Chr09g0371881 [Helianthus annuus]|uniref:Uncharacterized protein n=1 Tax=Helianthus annuus TaxID=4232 RepID=A0A9K3I4B7_HELAN|nr:hypothetical protein HanXRQr2_Chr09g0371881 [Helianthus annuus]